MKTPIARPCLLALNGCHRDAMPGDDLCEMCATHYRRGHITEDACEEDGCERILRTPRSFRTRRCWEHRTNTRQEIPYTASDGLPEL